MTANPCPCGNLGRRQAACICSTAEVKHYWKRLGGALLDRIDIRVPVNDTPAAELLDPGVERPDDYLGAVQEARARQQHRYRDRGWSLNGVCRRATWSGSAASATRRSSSSGAACGTPSSPPAPCTR